MAERKVFVSYDHSEDVDYKRLLQAWDANTNFDFEFDSRGPNIPIDSVDASVIKAALTTKMKCGLPACHRRRKNLHQQMGEMGNCSC